MKAVFFDLDGTLVESLSGLTEALNQVFDDVGKKRITEHTVRGYVGDGLWLLIRRALPKNEFSDERITDLQENFRRHYADVWRDGTEIFDGVPELLNALKSKGIQLGILSNKQHPFTVEIVEALFGRELIPMIYGQRDGIPIKPDPSALIAMCEEAGLPANEVTYVGDSTIDLETAKGAGTHGVGVTWGYHDKEHLEGFVFPLCDSVSDLSDTLLNGSKA